MRATVYPLRQRQLASRLTDVTALSASPPMVLPASLSAVCGAARQAALVVVFESFFRAAAKLAGSDGSVFPGRERLAREFRANHFWPTGAPCVWRLVIGKLRQQQLVETQACVCTALIDGVTFGQVLRALESMRRGRRKRLRPRRAPQSSWP
jgi:hypothetical protein